MRKSIWNIRSLDLKIHKFDWMYITSKDPNYFRAQMFADLAHRLSKSLVLDTGDFELYCELFMDIIDVFTDVGFP